MMRVTDAMVLAAIRAEYDYYQPRRTANAGRHIPTPKPVIRAMLTAALATTEPPPLERPMETPEKRPVIVTAHKPRPR